MKRMKEKMCYEDWCKLTGRKHGITIIKPGRFNYGRSIINVEIFPTSKYEPFYSCLELDYKWQDGLTEEENQMIFWNRANKLFMEIKNSTGDSDGK